jgi:hypothetical protein
MYKTKIILLLAFVCLIYASEQVICKQDSNSKTDIKNCNKNEIKSELRDISNFGLSGAVAGVFFSVLDIILLDFGFL